jgi:hypothetical protein
MATLHWKLHASDGPAATALLNTAAIILLDPFDGEVRFQLEVPRVARTSA